MRQKNIQKGQKKFKQDFQVMSTGYTLSLHSKQQNRFYPEAQNIADACPHEPSPTRKLMNTETTLPTIH